MRFTKPLGLPKDVIDRINRGDEEMPGVEICVAPQDYDEIRFEDDDQEASFRNVLRGWQVSHLTEDEMTIALDFYEPEKISQGDQPDLILIAF